MKRTMYLRHQPRRLRLVAALTLALVLVLAACSSGSSASEGALSIRITAPADGAAVGSQFMVMLDPSVQIGDPSTGRHHVHLYYDGNRSSNPADYDIAYSPTFTVTRLSPGQHTIEAVVANADHSVTSARTQITVSVGSGATAGAPATTTASSVNPYGY
jgi:hypothetical protein